MQRPCRKHHEGVSTKPEETNHTNFRERQTGLACCVLASKRKRGKMV